MADEPIMEKEETGDGAATAEEFQFQTEVNQILQLLIHSLYTKREIFLRELISNAADALNKIQFELLTQREVVSRDAELAIQIDFDSEARTITVSDTGIGMTRKEFIENLGTIAHSGSRAFLERMKEQEKEGSEGAALELIGQFGVGFYSIFMVADRVTVTSKSMIPGEEAYTWTTTGQSGFSLTPATREGRGTTVTLYLKDDASEFLSKYRLEEIIRNYSNYVPFPVKLQGDVANRQKALWAQSKAEITEEMYTEFYGHLSHTTRPPLAHLHLQADVPLQFNAILYVPHEAPMVYYPLDQKHGVRLYVKRMFIQENCEELVPRYMRFLVGVVDVDDLPLNVSREMIQSNPLLAKVQSNLVRKTLKLFQDIAKDDSEKYTKLWNQFGLFLKEGIREDNKSEDMIVDLLRFNSSHHVDDKGLTSLAEYVDRMPEGQTEIYYFTGLNRESIERSPHLELMKKKHYEVLYLTDAIDPLVILGLGSYKDKKFRIIDDPSLKLDEGESKEESPAETVGQEDLAGFMKQVLGDRVEDVRVSKRLVESPSCLVNPEKSMSSDMQRLYSMMDKDFKFSRKILEINAAHPIIVNLATAYQAVIADPPGQEKLRPYVRYVLDAALLAEGLHPNPAELVPGLYELMKVATGTLYAAKPGVSGVKAPADAPAPAEESPVEAAE